MPNTNPGITHISVADEAQQVFDIQQQQMCIRCDKYKKKQTKNIQENQK